MYKYIQTDAFDFTLPVEYFFLREEMECCAYFIVSRDI